MAQKKVHILTMLVDNEFGVLTRITALIRREGWNIKSLAVSETINHDTSRLTISLECLDSSLPQVLARLDRFDCVHSVTAYSDETHICRELVVLQTCADRPSVLVVAGKYGARIILEEGGCMTLELSDTPENIDAFFKEMEPLGLQGYARTGATTFEKIQPAN